MTGSSTDFPLSNRTLKQELALGVLSCILTYSGSKIIYVEVSLFFPLHPLPIYASKARIASGPARFGWKLIDCINIANK